MSAHVTKADVEALDRKLDATRDELRGEIGALDRKLDATRDGLRGEIGALDRKLDATRDELRGEIRANGVVLEDVRAQMRGLAEAVGTLVGRTELDERESRLSARITVLESAIVGNSNDIRENTRRIASVEKRLKRAR